MNFALEGYNECLITYVIASSPSPNNSAAIMKDGKKWRHISTKTKYNLPLILKHNGAEELGGPLFCYYLFRIRPKSVNG
jgi:hypothetical protein